MDINAAPHEKLNMLHCRVLDIPVCIDLQYVNKALLLVTLESVPGSPDYFVGLMNYAGNSIGVIDLATRLGFARKKQYSLNTPILLCASSEQNIGIVVDDIYGLINIDTQDVQMRNEFDKPDSPLSGIVSTETDLLFLINMKNILTFNLIDKKRDLALDYKVIEKVRHEYTDG
ncbi:MAG: chemotaxis protein CheW [Gammaproteobacteria bacterium]|nr:chemotaxis protein CheW [Gammaproteobacteria bacterium]